MFRPLAPAAFCAAILLLACSDEPAADAPAPYAPQDAAGPAPSAPGAPPARIAQEDQAPAARGPTAALPDSAFRMRKVDIVDAHGFARPMTAMSLLIPHDWREQGGIVWNPLGQCGSDYATQWSAAAPDGLSGIYIMPAAHWSMMRSVYGGAQQQQCEQAGHRDARSFLEATARKLHPNARILDYRPSPEEAKPYQEAMQQSKIPDSPGMRSSISVDAGELLIGFQDGGRDMRAVLSATVFVIEGEFYNLSVPGQVDMSILQGFPSSLTIVRAPEGRLDLDLRRRVMRTMRLDPAWMAEIERYMSEKSRRRHQATMDGMQTAHRARMEAIRSTSDIINGGYRDRQLAEDRMQRETIEAIRGVETYYDPVEDRPVQFDHVYDQAWRINDGSYVLTNDAMFNPGQYGLDGQQLKVMQ